MTTTKYQNLSISIASRLEGTLNLISYQCSVYVCVYPISIHILSFHCFAAVHYNVIVGNALLIHKILTQLWKIM